MDNCNKEIDLLFETSWEVCNKIGGIYTVLSTKARTLQTLYKDKVIFIGPDVWSEDNPFAIFYRIENSVAQMGPTSIAASRRRCACRPLEYPGQAHRHFGEIRRHVCRKR